MENTLEYTAKDLNHLVVVDNNDAEASSQADQYVERLELKEKYSQYSAKRLNFAAEIDGLALASNILQEKLRMTRTALFNLQQELNLYSD